MKGLAILSVIPAPHIVVKDSMDTANGINNLANLIMYQYPSF